MNEHVLAGKSVTLLIDGKEEEYQMEEGISHEAGEKFINSMLGVDASELPEEVQHPDFEFADIPSTECPNSKGFRLVCNIDGCEETQVFDGCDEVKNSEWTEVTLPIDYLTDMTELCYGYCSNHSLQQEEQHSTAFGSNLHGEPPKTKKRYSYDIEEGG